MADIEIRIIYRGSNCVCNNYGVLVYDYLGGGYLEIRDFQMLFDSKLHEIAYLIKHYNDYVLQYNVLGVTHEIVLDIPANWLDVENYVPYDESDDFLDVYEYIINNTKVVEK